MKNLIFFLMIVLVCAPLSIAGTSETTKIPEAVEKDLQMSKGPEQNKALTKDIADWVKKEPLVVLSWASREASKELSNFIGPQVLRALVPVNGEVAADWLIKNFGPPDYWRLHQLLLYWSQFGGHPEAVVWCLKAPAEVRYMSIFSVGDGLCRKDPPAAADWALKLKAEKRDRLAAVHGVILMWARGDFAKATEWIKNLEPAEAKFATVVMLSEWKNNKEAKGNDVTAKKKWLEQLPFSDTEKEELLKSPPFDTYGRNVK